MRRRPVRTWKRHLLRLAFAAATALACASASRVADVAAPASGPDVAEFGRAAQVVLVLPLNVAVAMPEGLEGRSLSVALELDSHLREHGKKVKTVSYPDARRLWLMSVERARRSGGSTSADFGAAAKLLVGELRRHAEFDALVVPSVFVQQATMQGTRATWDGVTRPVEIRRDNRRIRRSELRASRTAPCVSLHVAVFDSNGRQIHEGRGGLDLLVRAYIDEGLSEYLTTSDFWYFEARPELFDDPALLREGVAKALDPFLPLGENEREPL